MHKRSWIENSNQEGNDRKVCSRPTFSQLRQENTIGQILIPPDCKCMKEIGLS